MSIDVRNSRIICDGKDCASVLAVPLRMRRWRDEMTLEPRVESSAAGWAFLSGIRADKHYCPKCSSKLISDRAGEVERLETAFA